MFCVNCGTKYRDMDKFCAKCGQPLRQPDEVVDTKDVEVNPKEETTDSIESSASGSWLTSIVTLCFCFLGILGGIITIPFESNPAKYGAAFCLLCGGAAGIMAKRCGRSGILWFFIGMLLIGFGLFFILTVIGSYLRLR